MWLVQNQQIGLSHIPRGAGDGTATAFACLLCGGFMAAIAIIKAYLQAHNPRRTGDYNNNSNDDNN